MNVFIKLKGYNDEDNCFFLEDLNVSLEEQWILAAIAAASQEGKSEGCPIFDYYIVPDEDVNSFREFYHLIKTLTTLEYISVCEKFPEEKVKEWLKIIS